MPTEIVRQSHNPSQTVTFTTSLGTTGGFNLTQYAGATIYVVTSGAGETLTWHAKWDNDPAVSAYEVWQNDNSAAVTTTITQGRAYAVPDELFGAAYVMAVATGGTVTCRVTVKG